MGGQHKGTLLHFRRATTFPLRKMTQTLIGHPGDPCNAMGYQQLDWHDAWTYDPTGVGVATVGTFQNHIRAARELSLVPPPSMPLFLALQ